jgi:type I restriction enzyme, S subunit
MFIETSARHISEAGYRSCGTQLLPAGTVILSSRAPIGHLAIAATEVCTNQGCKSFVPGSNVDSKFLYYSLKQRIPELRELGSGATFAEVSKSQLENLAVAVPPIEEQCRIGAVLTQQLAVVDRARAAAEAKLAAARELPAAYLREVFESRAAASWPRVQVGEIVKLVIDGPHVTPTYVTNGVPFLTVRNIVSRRIDLSDASYVTEEDHAAFSARGRVEVDDILYTKDGTMGIPCVVDEPIECSFFVSVALIKLQRDIADPHYVAFALESPRVLDQVEKLGAGAGLKHMVLRSIRALRIPLPSLERQKRVADSLKARLIASERLKAGLVQEVAMANGLPAALLRQAFNGEL